MGFDHYDNQMKNAQSQRWNNDKRIAKAGSETEERKAN